MNKYKNIFQPFSVKSLNLRNRIVMTPMGTNYGEQNGEMSFLHINYYEQRARGGTGMIIVENVCVDWPLGSNGTTQLRMDQDNYIPRLFKLCENIHKQGGAVAVQINHAGASAMKSRINHQPVSAGNLPSKAGGEIPRPLMIEEIKQIAVKFGDAARRAQIAGFDAVEVHAGHSYLISQFMSSITNNRNDEYGGSPENRSRFAKLVMSEVRKAVGEEYPIILRISADEFMEGGNTLDDTLEMLPFFAQEADIIDVSCGLNESIQYQIDSCSFPDGWRSYMAKAVKESLGKPVMTMGNIRNPQVAETILAEGEADLIGIGRGLIAEPEWCNKVQYGKEEELRKCISCNIGCAGNRIGFNRPIRCTVNPAVNEGDDYKKNKVTTPCNVVVVGGGTAGLEAACTAAEVGCTTFLYEKKDNLGGLASVISRLPDKKRIQDFPDYLVNRALALKNLFVFTNTEADAARIKQVHPDIIITATGSSPLLPAIDGLHEVMEMPDSKVDSITLMIDKAVKGEYDGKSEGKQVVVVGGGAVGIDVAEYFAPKGAKVTIVEMMDTIGADLDPVSKNNAKTIMDQYEVNKMTNTMLKEVKKDSFIVKQENQTIELPFDYGFVCLGMHAENSLESKLKEAFKDEPVEIFNIGDSVKARRIIDGVAEGRNIITILKKLNYMN